MLIGRGHNNVCNLSVNLGEATPGADLVVVANTPERPWRTDVEKDFM